MSAIAGFQVDLLRPGAAIRATVRQIAALGIQVLVLTIIYWEAPGVGTACTVGLRTSGIGLDRGWIGDLQFFCRVLIRRGRSCQSPRSKLPACNEGQRDNTDEYQGSLHESLP